MSTVSNRCRNRTTCRRHLWVSDQHPAWRRAQRTCPSRGWSCRIRVYTGSPLRRRWRICRAGISACWHRCLPVAACAFLPLRSGAKAEREATGRQWSGTGHWICARYRAEVRQQPIMEPDAKRAVLVLGMHRSGTSAVAGVAHLLGAEAPKHMIPAATDNPSGFFEAIIVLGVNDWILTAGGSTWFDCLNFDPDSLPPRTRSTGIALVNLSLIGEFKDASLLLLKDP